MRKILVSGAVFSLWSGSFLRADVSYQESVHYTGGSLVEMLRNMNNSFIGKMAGGRMGKALQDQTSKVYVKGNKMAHIGDDMSSIVDFDAGTITNIDHQRRTYSVSTFEEIRQRMEKLRQQMSKNGGAPTPQFAVKVDSTGNTREIEGQTAKEFILNLAAEMQEGQGTSMKVRSEMWTVPAVAGMAELRELTLRFGEKMASSVGGMNPMMGSAGAGLSALSKEAAKVEGWPISQNTSVSGVQSPMGPMAALSGGTSDPNAAFLTFTTDSSHFSDAPVDGAVFQVPSGYKEQRERR